MSNSPWASMKRPHQSDDISTRKLAIGREDGISVFWVLTYDGLPAFKVEYPVGSEDARLPRFKTLRVTKRVNPAKGVRAVQIDLLNLEMTPLFERLCLDIADSMARCQPKRACVHLKLRLEKWKLLLSGKPGMSPEAEKGLIAELRFLQRNVLQLYSPADAIAAWTGPDKSARDFVLGNTCVEVKSNRGTLTGKVSISSEKQLSVKPPERLFLYVLGINESPSSGESLRDVVGEVRASLVDDLLAQEEFDLKVASVGYRADRDDDERRWAEGLELVYEVRDGFPRLSPDDLMAGIMHTKYDIDLSYCSEYLATIEYMSKSMGEQ